MKILLSNLVNNFSEGIHRIKFKFEQDDKKCETCGIKNKYCHCFLGYTNFKDDLIEYKCLCFNKIFQRKFDEKLEERYFNTYNFSNHDNKKFILLLQKGDNPCEYMDDWEEFNETLLPEKEDTLLLALLLCVLVYTNLILPIFFQFLD